MGTIHGRIAGRVEHDSRHNSIQNRRDIGSAEATSALINIPAVSLIIRILATPWYREILSLVL